MLALWLFETSPEGLERRKWLCPQCTLLPPQMFWPVDPGTLSVHGLPLPVRLSKMSAEDIQFRTNNWISSYVTLITLHYVWLPPFGRTREPFIIRVKIENVGHTIAFTWLYKTGYDLLKSSKLSGFKFTRVCALDYAYTPTPIHQPDHTNFVHCLARPNKDNKVQLMYMYLLLKEHLLTSFIGTA